MTRLLLVLFVLFSFQGCAATGWVSSWREGDYADQSWTLVDDVPISGGRMAWVRIEFADGRAPELRKVEVPTGQPLRLEAAPHMHMGGFFLGSQFFRNGWVGYDVGNDEAREWVELVEDEAGLGWHIGSWGLTPLAFAFDTVTFPVQALINLALLS